MKKLNWIIIISVAILTTISCCREDKPLSIEPMEAIFCEFPDSLDPAKHIFVSRKVDDYFYLRNFNNSKEELKQILSFLSDTTNHFPPKEYTTLCLRENAVYEEDGGIYYRGDAFIIGFNQDRINELLFEKFDTPSDYLLDPVEIYYMPEKYDYQYILNEAKDTATITINYSDFDTDALQRFINIVLYYRNERLVVNFKYVAGGNSKNTPTKYILLNPKDNEPEAIITYPYGNERAFTIEII